MMKQAVAIVGLSVLLGWPATSQAFCGFYVSGADASLYNNATMVVLMRHGTRTVLSMQNNYQGPPEDFAMVVPVPVVLQEENVKTLPAAIFDRVDKLAAPRLVEYWEQDPCQPQVMYEMMASPMSVRRKSTVTAEGAADLGVTIEAQFKVAEYDIVILSAKDSSGLDKWLRLNKYNIPKGAEKVLRPYVEQDIKFFVAKVDIKKVKFEGGKVVLSPLRFHYDSKDFSLPVRLGLLNSGGQQDLIVHVLAKGQRYEVANYKNTTIPTNIRVENSVREGFGGFYEALFQRTIEKNPGAVVTEYSWDATSCDPCPEPPLTPGELATLGADVIVPGEDEPYQDVPGVIPQRRRPIMPMYDFVLTRLHYRYGKDGLDEDLVFKTAAPIVGGRGMPDQNGELQERRAQPAGMNNFQGRYVILHAWEGALACENPVRGTWGGPPGDRPTPRPFAAGNLMLKGLKAPTLIAPLPGLIQTDIPELGLKAGAIEPPPKGKKKPGKGESPSGEGASNTPDEPSTDEPKTHPRDAKACALGYGLGSPVGWLAVIGVAGWLIRRRAL